MKKYKVCFIGTGWMGSTQLRKLSNFSEVEITVVVDDNTTKAEKVVKEIGLKETSVVSKLEDAIERYQFDIVWIVSPNSFHGKQSLIALRNGKHVFCEKPPATTYQDFCDQIEITTKNKELKSMVDYILFFNPMEIALKNMVRNNFFGEVHQIQVNYRHPVNIDDDKKWKLSKSIMGDALGMGINHAISVIVFLMSAQTTPVSVYATSSNTNIRGFEPDPVWNIMIKFENGATAICQGNIDIENGYDLFHNIAGSKGGFIFDSRVDMDRKIRFWNSEIEKGKWVYPFLDKISTGNKLVQSFTPKMMLPDSGDVLDHQVERAIEHFLTSVSSNKDSPLSFYESKIIGEIGWAAQLSSKYDKIVKLPLTKEDQELAKQL
jgi:myo-inositol 2-dehydrogenase/D-chiro-inositol 1-dehydrogenase